MLKVGLVFSVLLAATLFGCSTSKNGVGPNPPPAPPPPPPDGQVPTATITSPTGGSYLTGMVPITISAQDNVGVTKVEMLIDGIVAATDNAAPWEFSWNTDPLEDGSRNMVARAYDLAGNVGSSSVVPVTIRHPFALSFKNWTYTDIALTVQNQTTRTVSPGTVLTYNYVSKPSSVGFLGSTSGRTTQGGQVGLLMGWNDTYISGSVRNDTVDLIIAGTYFFIKLQNCGSIINGLYVNYGLVNQTYDNISIAGDCVTRSIGYYRAFTNSEVLALKLETHLRRRCPRRWTCACGCR